MTPGENSTPGSTYTRPAPPQWLRACIRIFFGWLTSDRPAAGQISNTPEMTHNDSFAVSPGGQDCLRDSLAPRREDGLGAARYSHLVRVVWQDFHDVSFLEVLLYGAPEAGGQDLAVQLQQCCLL